MAGGLLDFLFSQGGQGGGLLGSLGQQGGQQMGPDGMPMQISPGPQQQMLNVPNLPQQQPMMPSQGMPGMTPQNQAPGMAGSLDPSFFANQVRQNQQPAGLLFNADSGLLGGMRGALNQIGDPQGQRQQQAIQNYLAVKAAEEKPQYMKVQDPNTGIDRLVQIQPFGRGASYLNPNEPGGQGGPPQPNPAIPAGADVKTYREKIGAAAAANEEDAVKSAKAAADMQPHIDKMTAAYERAIELNAIGPYAGSTPARMLNKYVVGGEGEKARQDYELAKAAVQARITAAQNKGEGAVSNYERGLYAAQFPDLQMLDPHSGLATLKQIQQQTGQTIGAGKIPSMGQAPAVAPVLNRPAVGAPSSPAGPAIAPPSGAIRLTSKAQFDMLPSGSTFIAPDGSTRRKP